MSRAQAAAKAVRSAAAAHERFVFYREADETTTSKLACDCQTANCTRDRMPVVTMMLSALPSGR